MPFISDDLIRKLNALSLPKFRETLIPYVDSYLLSLKEECDRRYYVTGEDTLDDIRYDILVEELTNRGIILSIGCKLREGDNKVDLPVYLPGMDKIKFGEDKKLSDWYGDDKKTTTYVVSDKLNGVSCLVGMINGEYGLFTRGDKTVGSDISYFKNSIHGVKGNLKEGEFARGEIIVKTIDYEQFPDKKKNILSTIVGAINSKTLKSTIKILRFVAYEFISDKQITPEEGLKILEKKKFEVVRYSIEKKRYLSDDLGRMLEERRLSSIYDIDGLIIQKNTQYDRDDIASSGNPKYAIAFKNNVEIGESIVEDVEWNVSRYGKLIPIVKIVPTFLHGTTIKNLSGFNGAFIRDSKINVGTTIIFTRSGDIIPYILQVKNPGHIGKMPTQKYYWDGLDIYLENTKDEKIAIERLSYFFQHLNCKHISTGIVRKLYDSGYTDIFSILNGNPTDMAKIHGLGTSIIDKLMEIKNILKSTTLLDIMVASSEFQGFGERRINNIIKKVDIFSKFSKDDLTQIEGISDITADKFILYLPAFIKFYKKIKPYINFEETEVQYDTKFTDVTFVFSGFRDKDMEEYIKKNGGNVGSAVSKKTTYLVVKDKTQSSTKIDKAISLGVKIINLKEFKEL